MFTRTVFDLFLHRSMPLTQAPTLFLGPQSFQAETFPGAAQTAMLPDMHAAGPSVPGELCSQTKTHLMSLNACCKGTSWVVTLNLQN